MLKKGGTECLEIKECVDIYMARLQFDTNVLLEGNQQAVESFRNNMSTASGPKPDPAVMKLLNMALNRNPRDAALDTEDRVRLTCDNGDL